MQGLLIKLERELKLRNSSRKTIKGYLYSVGKFLEYSKDKGLNKTTVEDYILKKLNRQNPSTVSKDLFAIKFFFKNILNEGLDLPNPKKNKTIPNILTIEEIKKLIESTSNIKHKLIIKLLYGCGFRVSEIVNLKKNCINFDEGIIHIKFGKGKKDRFVKIPDSILVELEKYCGIDDSEILFPSNRGGKLTIKSIQKIVQNSTKKAGIKKRDMLTKKVVT